MCCEKYVSEKSLHFARSTQPSRQVRVCFFSLWILGLLVLVVFTSSCAASFSPPARGDMDFAATRVGPGQPEVEAGMMANALEGFTGSLASRFAISERYSAEFGFLRHSVEVDPRDEEIFTMGSVGIRYLLSDFSKASDASAPLNLNFGFGVGAGRGGQVAEEHANAISGSTPATGTDEEVDLSNRAVASYVDVGFNWRALDWLTPFCGARLQRSVSYSDGAGAPPTTDWLQVGVGVRADLENLYGVVSAQRFFYGNRLDEGGGGNVGFTVGWRFGEAEDKAPEHLGTW